MRTETETIAGTKWRPILVGFGAAIYRVSAEGRSFRCYVSPVGRCYLYHRSFEDLIIFPSRAAASRGATEIAMAWHFHG